ncbi:TetR/AcrR family transcriptional regulator [Rhodococcus koreensis]|uniref:TetR/AcrR family transcriptional regulator n=1 Tax=Rhodococcus koreensis TaxID=99653 RepID=UPI00366A9E42
MENPVSTNRAPTAARRRRFDPERRARIIRAAVDVVGEIGVEKLTLRAVAAVADVPLGSMTYHFSNVDDLLVSALEMAAEESTAYWCRWGEELPAGADLAEELAILLERLTTGPARRQTAVELDLYLASMRRPHLRSASLSLARIAYVTLEQHTDLDTARALSFMSDGLVLEALASDRPLKRDECVAMLRRVFPH